MDTEIMTGVHLLETGDRYGYTPELIDCAERLGFIDRGLSMEDATPDNAKHQIQTSLMEKVKTALSHIWDSIRSTSSSVYSTVLTKWNTLTHKHADDTKLEHHEAVSPEYAAAMVNDAEVGTTLVGRIMSCVKTGMLKTKAGMQRLGVMIKEAMSRIKGKFSKPPEDAYNVLTDNAYDDLDLSQLEPKKASWTRTQWEKLKASMSSLIAGLKSKIINQEPHPGTVNPFPVDPSDEAGVTVAKTVHFMWQAIKFCAWVVKEIIETCLQVILGILVGLSL